MKKNLIAAAVAAGCALGALPASAATLVLINVDPPGVGFNDATPAAPVGGNPGTTVGEQRLFAYQRALDLWGGVLSSDVEIYIQGSFAPLSCTPTGGTLAQAGATFIFNNFTNAPLADTWFGSSLADAIAGRDLLQDPPNPLPPGTPDIIANFNGNVGQPNCIAGPGWYYGVDNNTPTGAIDFLNTFMHEVAHGLGFQNFANEVSGGLPGGLPDVYMTNTLDLDQDQTWDEFTTAGQIVASAVNTGRVVWSGDEVTANAPLVLGPFEGVRLTGKLNEEIEIGTASFGPAPSADNLSGAIVLANDGLAGGTLTDGCEPFANAAEIAGNVALVDRGLCGFTVKAANAQAAGATAVIIANNVEGTIGLGGADPSITIPAVSVGLSTGNAIKATLPGVNVEYFVDPSRLAGTAEGYVRLYAPGTVALGSSISHFDSAAAPNLLMEPAITSTLEASRNLDLTPSLMQDIGWRLESLVIGGCDTGVANALPNGELLSVAVDECAAGAGNPGQFVSCVSQVTNNARDHGLLSGRDKAAITTCAAR